MKKYSYLTTQYIYKSGKYTSQCNEFTIKNSGVFPVKVLGLEIVAGNSITFSNDESNMEERTLLDVFFPLGNQIGNEIVLIRKAIRKEKENINPKEFIAKKNKYK